MTQYCIYENNEVKGVWDVLPTNYKSVSNFNLLTVESLSEFNVYPFNETLPDLTETQILHTPTDTFSGNTVARTWTVRSKTEDELADEKQARNNQRYYEITLLESTQARAIREVVLGIDGGLVRLQSINDQIALIRSEIE